MLTPDPAQAEREALVKAEADQAAVAERKQREETAFAAEYTAPLATRTAALPERLTTLKYLPTEDQQLYARDVDGSFVLAYIRITDELSVGAYTDRLGKGITVLSDGETPTTRAAREHRQKEMEAKVQEILARDAKAKAEKEMAAADARIQAEIAKLNAERERIARQYNSI